MPQRKTSGGRGGERDGQRPPSRATFKKTPPAQAPPHRPSAPPPSSSSPSSSRPRPHRASSAAQAREPATSPACASAAVAKGHSPTEQHVRHHAIRPHVLLFSRVELSAEDLGARIVESKRQISASVSTIVKKGKGWTTLTSH
jgi:hypothetical protein